MDLDSHHPIIRRRTVITIGSPPRQDDSSKMTAELESTEVGETACGSISIQVKTNDNNSYQDPIEEHSVSPEQPNDLDVNQEELTAKDTVTLHPSAEDDPLWTPDVVDEDIGFIRSLIVVEPAEQPEDEPKSFQTVGSDEMGPVADYDSLPPVPKIRPADQEADSTFQPRSINNTKQSDWKNDLEQEEQDSFKNNKEIKHINYLEWLKTLDTWPDEGKHKFRAVSFDPVEEEETEDEIQPEAEPRVVVVETVKQPAPPKSILKNNNRSVNPPDTSEEDAQKLAWKLEYHQKKAMLGSKLMSLASGEQEMSFTGTLIQPLSGTVPPSRPLVVNRIKHHPLLTALIANGSEPYYSSLPQQHSCSIPQSPSDANASQPEEEEDGNLSAFHEAAVHDVLPTTRNGLTSISEQAEESQQAFDGNEEAADTILEKNEQPTSVDQVDVVGWNKINSIKSIRTDDIIPQPVMPSDVTSSMTLSFGMPVDRATELVRQFFNSPSNSRPGSQPSKENTRSLIIHELKRKLSLPESSLMKDLARFSLTSCGETSSDSSDLGSSTLDSPPSGTVSISSLEDQVSLPSSEMAENPRGRTPVKSRIPILVPRPLRSSCFVLPLLPDNPPDQPDEGAKEKATITTSTAPPPTVRVKPTVTGIRVKAEVPMAKARQAARVTTKAKTPKS